MRKEIRADPGAQQVDKKGKWESLHPSLLLEQGDEIINSFKIFKNK